MCRLAVQGARKLHVLARLEAPRRLCLLGERISSEDLSYFEVVNIEHIFNGGPSRRNRLRGVDALFERPPQLVVDSGSAVEPIQLDVVLAQA